MDNEEEITISVDDLINVIKIFNTASERGAFHGPELSFVGKYYDRITKFIEYAQNQQNAEPTINGSKQSERSSDDS